MAKGQSFGIQRSRMVVNMTESQKISENDNMGREKFWEDLGRPVNDGLALKMFRDQCCTNCSCQAENRDTITP
jgi:hypothetical protein